MDDVRIREAHVEPRRVERCRARDRTAKARKIRKQEFNRAQIDGRRIDREVPEAGECWLENVQLAMPANARGRAAHVGVAEDHVALVDVDRLSGPPRARTLPYS